MPETVKVQGLSAAEIVYEALYLTWEEPLCKDPECKCTNSIRWRAAQAVQAAVENVIKTAAELQGPMGSPSRSNSLFEELLRKKLAQKG